MAKAKAKDREPALFEETPAPQGDLEKKNQGVIKAREPTKKQRAALEAAPKGGAVVLHKPETVVPLSDFQATLATFERLAVNPKVNPESLGKILDVQERLLDRMARDVFDEHLIALQEDLPVFDKDGEVLAEGQAKQSGRSYKAKFKFAKWETASRG